MSRTAKQMDAGHARTDMFFTCRLSRQRVLVGSHHSPIFHHLLAEGKMLWILPIWRIWCPFIGESYMIVSVAKTPKGIPTPMWNLTTTAMGRDKSIQTGVTTDMFMALVLVRSTPKNYLSAEEKHIYISEMVVQIKTFQRSNSRTPLLLPLLLFISSCLLVPVSPKNYSSLDYTVCT